MKKKILLLSSAWANTDVFESMLPFIKEDVEFIHGDHGQFTSIEQAAEHFLAEHEQVHAIIGLSMGGFIALELVKQKPAFCEKLVLMGTYAHPVPSDYHALFLELRKELENGKLPELTDMYIDMAITEQSKQNHALVQQLKDVLLEVGAQACINNHIACLEYTDHTPMLTTIKQETLVIHGESDPGIALESSQTLAEKIPHARLEVIEQASHFMQMDQPEKVGDLINEFLGK